MDTRDLLKGAVLLHNQFLRTFDYETRQISLNREQTVLAADSSFKIVVACQARA
ncbi:MAG: hypothetical protein O7F73_12870 [Gammaproteobacteria bacterium]|nr:hypothetical protein [Gammaproteobacteria bacterium]